MFIDQKENIKLFIQGDKEISFKCKARDEI